MTLYLLKTCFKTVWEGKRAGGIDETNSGTAETVWWMHNDHCSFYLLPLNKLSSPPAWCLIPTYPCFLLAKYQIIVFYLWIPRCPIRIFLEILRAYADFCIYQYSLSHADSLKDTIIYIQNVPPVLTHFKVWLHRSPFHYFSLNSLWSKLVIFSYFSSHELK